MNEFSRYKLREAFINASVYASVRSYGHMCMSVDVIWWLCCVHQQLYQPTTTTCQPVLLCLCPRNLAVLYKSV